MGTLCAAVGASQEVLANADSRCTCSACGQERVWPTKEKCFRCGCPRTTDSRDQDLDHGPTGRLPQRPAAVNPTLRPSPLLLSPTSSCGGTETSELPSFQSQALSPIGAYGTAPPFVPGMRVDMLRDFLQAILSQKDSGRDDRTQTREKCRSNIVVVLYMMSRPGFSIIGPRSKTCSNPATRD